MREKYESLPLAELKAIAKARGLRGISTMRKPELIERMLEEDRKEASESAQPVQKAEESVSVQEKSEKTEAAPASEKRETPVKSRTIIRRNP